MVNTRHIVIEETNRESFQIALNDVSNNNNVFATQTHVTTQTGILLFHAVCFIRGACDSSRGDK